MRFDLSQGRRLVISIRVSISPSSLSRNGRRATIGFLRLACYVPTYNILRPPYYYSAPISTCTWNVPLSSRPDVLGPIADFNSSVIAKVEGDNHSLSQSTLGRSGGIFRLDPAFDPTLRFLCVNTKFSTQSHSLDGFMGPTSRTFRSADVCVHDLQASHCV